jgi:diaminohydroxyphosphoribosylaminopyrimidine deaminase/5-amino-6-(5-phosphoribosylamino)uracil reductase
MAGSAEDVRHMSTAVALARRGLGDSWPNPTVGCVLVKDGRVIGRGWTQSGGRPHAETEALRRAAGAAVSATAFVSLEPCNHTGVTGPCTEALIEAGITRVVVGCADPDPRVNGSGLARLRDAGLEIVSGVCAAEAADVNEGFFSRINSGRPLITLKLATSLDGRIATAGGESQWITGETARAWAHGLRAKHDAILVGVGTALADNPLLTVRVPGYAGRPKVRIVLDARLQLLLTSKLVATAKEAPTWIITVAGVDPLRAQAFADCGVNLIEVPPDENGTVDIVAALRELGRLGLTRILVEGGAHIAGALLLHDLVDRVAWFRAPRVIGGDGRPAAVGFGVNRLAEMRDFVRTGLFRAGSDIMETYSRRA